MNISWITSCNERLVQDEIYGKCLLTWDKIPHQKYIFTEDNLSLPGFQSIDINKIINETGYFKEKRKGVLRRFYFKAVSIYWALKNLDSDYVVWLDSDVEVLKNLDFFPTIKTSLASLFHLHPHQKEMTEVSLSDSAVDTGIVIFNKSKLPDTFADEYIDYWHSNSIMTLQKAKDTFVLSDLLNRYSADNLMHEMKFYPRGTNFFKYTDFKEYFYHHIGREQKSLE